MLQILFSMLMEFESDDIPSYCFIFSLSLYYSRVYEKEKDKSKIEMNH